MSPGQVLTRKLPGPRIDDVRTVASVLIEYELITAGEVIPFTSAQVFRPAVIAGDAEITASEALAVGGLAAY